MRNASGAPCNCFALRVHSGPGRPRSQYQLSLAPYHFFEQGNADPLTSISDASMLVLALDRQSRIDPVLLATFVVPHVRIA
jgi:hypothetical protein